MAYSAGDIVGFLKLEGVSGFTDALGVALSGAEGFQKKLDTVMGLAKNVIVNSLTASIQYESAFAGVTKTIDGLLDPMGKLNESGQLLSDKFRQMALDIPITVENLAKIGEIGGQLGVGKQDIADFTDTIARLGTTTNLSFENGATALARFITVTQSVAGNLPKSEQFEKVASSVVDLGNNFATTESQIFTFANRLTASGVQIGLSQADILGLATSFSSIGLRAESAGTAFSTLFTNLDTALVTGGPKLESFAKAAGMSADKFKELASKDSSEALLAILGHIKELTTANMNVYPTINEIGGSSTRMREALLKASDSVGLVKDALDKSNLAYVENNALIKESETRFNTTESQIQLFKNAIHDSYIEMGDNFNPILNSVLKTLNDNPEVISTVTKTVLALGLAFGGLAAGIKAYQGISAALNTSLTGLKTALGPLAAIIAGITVAYNVYNAVQEAHAENLKKEAEKYVANASNIDILTGKYYALRDAGKSTYDIESQLIAQFESMGIITNGTIANLDELVRLSKEFTISGMEKEVEKLKNQIKELSDNMIDASPGVTGFLAGFGIYLNQSSIDKIAELKTKMGLLNDEITKQKDALDKTAENQKLLNDLGIESESAIRKNISAYEGLLEKEGLTKYEKEQISEKITQLKTKIGEINPELSDHNSKMKELKTLGIETTSSLQSQIDKYKSLVPLVKDDKLATEQLNTKIGELYLKLGDEDAYLKYTTGIDASTLSTKGLKDGLEKIRTPQKDFSDAMNLIATDAPKQASLISQLSKSFKEFDTGEFIQGIGDLVNDFANLGPTGKQSIGLMTDTFQGLLSGGIDPVSLGFKALNTVIGIFRKEHEYTKISVKDMIESWGAYGDQINKVKQILGSLQNTYDSDLLSNYNVQIESQTKVVNDLYNKVQEAANKGWNKSTSPYFQYFQSLGKDLQEQSGLLAKMKSDAEKLTSVFAVDKSLETRIDGLKKLTEESARLISEYGKNIDTSGLKQLLDEQIKSSENLLWTLDPTSKKYAELADNILLAKSQYAILNGEVKDANEYFVKNITYLASMGTSYDDKAKRLLNFFDSVVSVNMSVDEQKTYIENLLKTLNVGSVEYLAFQQRLDDLSKGIVDNSGDIEKATLKINEYVDQIAKYKQKIESSSLERIRLDEEFIPKISTAKGNVELLANALQNIDLKDDKLPNLWELHNIIAQTTGESRLLTLEWGKFQGIIDEFYALTDEKKGVFKFLEQAIKDIAYFKIDLEESTVDEQIGKKILELQDYAEGLNHESQAYKDFMDKVDEFKKAFADVGGIIDEDAIEALALDEGQSVLKGLNDELADLLTKYENQKIKLDADVSAAESKIAELKIKIDDLIKKYNIDIDINAILNGNQPDSFHSGGLITAHDGDLQSNERIIKAMAGEAIIPKKTVDKYTVPSWYNFMNTGDLNNLKRTDGSGMSVIVHRAGPETYLEINNKVIDQTIESRIRVNERYRSRGLYN